MRRLVCLATPLAICTLFLVPSITLAQDRSPELQRLNYLVGEWTWEGGDGGTATDFCEWLGTRVLKCDMEFNAATGATTKLVSVYGYNPDRGFYTWLRYYGDGNVDDHIGWVDGNTWTWIQRDSAGGHYRVILAEVSATRMTARWEASVKGGDWEPGSDWTGTKVP